jgi:RNA polymerase sigma-70 factor (ECF subfamily)
MANELDELTLARARQGEPSALTALVRQYEKPVFQLVGRLLCSRAPAAVDDVAQEAFIRVIRGIHRFDPRGPARLSTWILTVATRTCLNAMRGRNRDAPLDGHAAVLEAGDSPEQTVLERWTIPRSPPPSISKLEPSSPGFPGPAPPCARFSRAAKRSKEREREPHQPR